jgi:hypothetical protein
VNIPAKLAATATVLLAVTIPLTPAGLEPPAPWLEEDFSSYASTTDLLANPRGFYSVAEDEGTARVVLDTTSGYGTSRRSMQYVFPNRSNDLADRCHDFTIGRNIDLPRAVREVWVEVYARFSANFHTLAPRAWGYRSGAEYKFILGRTHGGSRFNLNAGTFGSAWTFGIPFDEQGDGGTPPKVVPGAAAVWDGLWHQYRVYFKVSSARGMPDGAARFYLDGRLIKSFATVVINDTDIYGVALGRNLNQGPEEPMSVWWGRIRIWERSPGW